MSDSRECSSQEERLKAALRDVFALIDEGFLVRNIDGDGASDWAIKAMRGMQRLAAAYQILEPQTDVRADIVHDECQQGRGE